MKRQVQSRAGFTLVEVMIGSTLAVMVMAAVLSTFIFLGRNLTRLANYHSLEAKGRAGLAYLSRDLAAVQSVKTGTSPTTTALTLVLPAGEVTYTYDGTNESLRRQANFGANRDITLLKGDYSDCTSFSFEYFTTSGGAPTSQISTGVNVPYSIKQIQVHFSMETPGTYSTGTRSKYDVVSARYLVRNKQLPDGT